MQFCQLLHVMFLPDAMERPAFYASSLWESRSVEFCLFCLRDSAWHALGKKAGKCSGSEVRDPEAE